ncbi:MAG: GtrA family protein [Candidatus Liptonbacteria bacterium]|nr:GtrA family protein [Candidatus Liptonbacteria bacterium]
MHRSDLAIVTVIGLAIGLLAQPVLTNVAQETTPALRAGVIVGCFLFAPFALFVAHLLGKRMPALYQFAKFGAVGTLNTLIDLGILNLMILAAGIAAGAGYSAMKAFSFLVATTNSFVWNKYWTFNAREPATSAEAAKFYGVAVAGWVLNVAVASLVVNLMGAPEAVSKEQWANVGGLAGVAASFLLNFLGYKFWVFRGSNR